MPIAPCGLGSLASCAPRAYLGWAREEILGLRVRGQLDLGQWRTGATQWAHTRGMRSRGTGTTRALPGSPFNQPPAVAIVAYAMSDRVSHDRYGLGTVVGTENGNAAVLVDFGPKVLRVALPTTKMVKL